jgi:Tol biopolymer transport system component
MRNNTLATLLVLSIYPVLFSCSNDKAEIVAIHYPSPRPDSVAMPFLPGMVSTDSVDFGSAFSPDGKSFYFSRSINKQSDIYVTRYNGTVWLTPELTNFSDAKYAEADPAFDRQGKLYFISTRPKNGADTLLDYDIWYVTPTPDGNWSAPQNLADINSDSNEYYVSFANDKDLYFSSSRAGGFGEEDVYVSRWKENRYSTAENIGPGINSARSEYDPFISPDEDFLIFTASNRNDTFGGGDLYCSSADGYNTWSTAKNLGRSFNTSSREYCAYLSPDSKFFFFTREKDVKWINADVLRKQILSFNN